MILLHTLMSFACVCLFGPCALAAPATMTSLEARDFGIPTHHGIIPFTRPARCGSTNVYCLSVLATRDHRYGDWFSQGGRISWIEDDTQGRWRTFGEQAIRMPR